jgi:hypothetical protein
VLEWIRVRWSTILLEVLSVSQLFKKFPTFYETRNFIAVSKQPGTISMSQIITIHALRNYVFTIKFNIILPY